MIIRKENLFKSFNFIQDIIKVIVFNIGRLNSEVKDNAIYIETFIIEVTIYIYKI